MEGLLIGISKLDKGVAGELLDYVVGFICGYEELIVFHGCGPEKRGHELSQLILYIQYTLQLMFIDVIYSF